MITIQAFRKLALSFPEATEEPHFENTSFRVKKKIFATYNAKTRRATIKLSEIDQDVFSLSNKKAIYPVDNKWGKQGWTVIELKSVKKAVFMDAITTSYCEVAPKKLAESVRPAE
jgi:predicted DNA-binding protein (MmcQ/YjbR family)